MSIILVEVDPGEILVDRDRFKPDLMEPTVIYEHLLYVCTKNLLLPTIFIEIENDSAFVVRNHWYLRIAKDLNVPRIRAIVDNASDVAAVKSFLQRPSVTQLDWEAIRRTEVGSSIEYQWLVFFFERSLTESDKRAFESQIVSFYRSLNLPAWVKTADERVTDLSYPYDGLCAEFRVLAPLGDERWWAASRSALEKFHRAVVPVVSFQGYKVEF